MHSLVRSSCVSHTVEFVLSAVVVFYQKRLSFNCFSRSVCEYQSVVQWALLLLPSESC